MNPQPGLVVDHKNGNKFDNRRRNLRVVKFQDNLLNSKPRNNRRFKGVYKIPSGFRVQFQGRYLGVYQDEITAAKKYNDFCMCYKTAYLNIIPR